jgi:lia operon protein LiaG
MGRLLKKLALLAFLSLLIGVSGLAYLFGKDQAWPIHKSGIHEEKRVDGKRVKRLEIKTATADVRLSRSPDENIHIELLGEAYKQAAHESFLRVEETLSGELDIEVIEAKRFFLTFGSLRDLELHVALPETEYEQLQVSTSTGDIESSDELKEKQLKLATSTGEIVINGYSGDELTVSSSTGDMRLININSGVIIESSTGSVEELQLRELSKDVRIETSTGDIHIRANNLPESASFDLESNTGELEVALSNLNVAHKSEHRLNATLGSGNGGPNIRVRSSTGDITFQP